MNEYYLVSLALLNLNRSLYKSLRRQTEVSSAVRIGFSAIAVHSNTNRNVFVLLMLINLRTDGYWDH